MGFFTHAGAAFIAFVAGYCWALHTWSEWEPRRPPVRKDPP